MTQWQHSSLHEPKQVQRFILDTRRRYEKDSYLDAYLIEDEIAERIITMRDDNWPFLTGDPI